MSFCSDNLSKNAMGGTELQKFALQSRLSRLDILKDFQIFVSRVDEELDENKIRIYWLHDLPGDPASEHLKDGGWNKFHILIFVSNWQMQAYINHYNIPWGKCIVIQNAIEPFSRHQKPTDGPLRLAYWSTPHRGLNILVPVFKELSKEFDIELDVYSSFNLYGWPERDKAYEELFQECRDDPKINYYGSVPNTELRDNLYETHIMAYPSTWPETSCITLIEAMSAKLECVHSNYGALPETAANLTTMYQYNEDPNKHAQLFYLTLRDAIMNYWSDRNQTMLETQSSYTNTFYSWDSRAAEWVDVLTGLARLYPEGSRKLENTSTSFFQYSA